MGKIKKNKDGLTVKFDIDEVILGPLYIKFLDDHIECIETIGNAIARVAWKKVLDNAPQLVRDDYAVKISGVGTVEVKYFTLEVNNGPNDD